MISAKTAATWSSVFTFPSQLAAITTPRSAATARSPVTASSRAMITIATHPARRSSETSETSAATIRSLSASGSISFPNTVTSSRRRAMYPSRPSVKAASANTPAASASPFGVSPRSATTITGTARMRSRVRTFGRLSGTISPGRLGPPVPRQLARAHEDLVEHLLGQLAGEGVLLAGVVRAQQGVRPDLGLSPVSEAGPRPREPMAQRARRPQSPVPGERAQGDQHAGAPQQPQLLDQ